MSQALDFSGFTPDLLLEAPQTADASGFPLPLQKGQAERLAAIIALNNPVPTWNQDSAGEGQNTQVICSAATTLNQTVQVKKGGSTNLQFPGQSFVLQRAIGDLAHSDLEQKPRIS